MRNLNEFTITEEVLRRCSNTPDPRTKLLMEALVRHLHDFAREVDLSETEWMEGIKFLTEVGRFSEGQRQEYILLSDTLGLSQLVVSQSNRRSGAATEQTVFGPFHVDEVPIRPHGYDISENAEGNRLEIRLQVLDVGGKPLKGALVEVWHADALGKYDTQDPDWASANCRYRGNFLTDDDGHAHLTTIMPCSYPIPTDGPVGKMMRATGRSPMRPAHIHFRVALPGFDTLVTHVFDGTDAFLDDDAVFGVLDSTIGEFVPVTEPGAGAEHYRLDRCLVLQPSGPSDANEQPDPRMIDRLEL
ncbi:6-chlorohydroxyquinol-1,2-dioxygenase [Novosphingobium resinovorum]|uniref:6-chlorohydroxyquinol-1,2-dioxygenase n=1 Tax=Novosphingobium resinovorum TaxID=158500 RepID=A0A031K408_9SPHN|nr:MULTISPECIES: dioxygenase [Novosphingobium]EZP83980.1 6-chlorohydroxyquinol-1,2-dioxygenase [Novosphingobium resinovorum]